MPEIPAIKPRGWSFDEWRSQLNTFGSAVIAEVCYRDWSALAKGSGKSAIAWVESIQRLQAHWEDVSLTPGPLSGVPCFVKDLFDQEGTPTLAGAKLRLKSPKAERDSLLVQELRKRGLVLAAKTHMHEFAYGLSGENPHFGNCPHPTVQDALSGGSSSGSAWAVGAGVAPIAIGTDTGGSIRVPSAFCGIYGYRKAPDAWCQEGAFPLAPSYDTAGWFTGLPEDMSYALDRLLPAGTENLAKLNGEGFWFPGWGNSPDEELQDTFLKRSQGLGLASPEKWQKRIALAFSDCGQPYSVLQSREAFEVHQERLDIDKAGYDPEVWARIDRGRHWAPKQIDESLDKTRRVQDALGELLEEFSFLVMPAVPFRTPRKRDFDLKLRDALLAYTTPGSMTGSPTLVLPIRLPDGRSSGLQILFKEDASALPLEVMKRWRIS